MCGFGGAFPGICRGCTVCNWTFARPRRRLWHIAHLHRVKANLATRLRRYDGAGLSLRFGWHRLDHGQTALQCRHAARDRVGDVGEAPDRGHQHHHGGHKGDETAHGDGALGIAGGLGLPECNREHGGECYGGDGLRQRRHGRSGHGGFERQLAQAAAQKAEALVLLFLRAMQAHHAMRQHVFLDHIGQFIRGLLALLGQTVEPARELAHDPGHAGHQHHDHHGQLPVQIEKVADQRDQREGVARQAEQGLHQHGGAALYFEHHGVGQAAGRLAREQPELGVEQAGEHVLAQLDHAVVGDAREGVLGRKACHTAHHEQRQHGGWNGPQLQRTLRETAIQQRLEQGRNTRFGQRAGQRGEDGKYPPFAVGAEIAGNPAQACRQGLAGHVGRCGRRCSIRRLRVGGRAGGGTIHGTRLFKVCKHCRRGSTSGVPWFGTGSGATKKPGPAAGAAAARSGAAGIEKVRNGRDWRSMRKISPLFLTVCNGAGWCSPAFPV